MIKDDWTNYVSKFKTRLLICSEFMVLVKSDKSTIATTSD